jgi:hypothetical protein
VEALASIFIAITYSYTLTRSKRSGKEAKKQKGKEGKSISIKHSFAISIRHHHLNVTLASLALNSTANHTSTLVNISREREREVFLCSAYFPFNVKGVKMRGEKNKRQESRGDVGLVAAAAFLLTFTSVCLQKSGFLSLHYLPLAQ